MKVSYRMSTCPRGPLLSGLKIGLLYGFDYTTEKKTLKCYLGTRVWVPKPLYRSPKRSGYVPGMYVCMYVCMYVHMYVRMYVCMDGWVYVCM